MGQKDKKRDPMPPPDATPEEIGEFWDTHSLADYLDETHEVDFKVNIKPRQDQTPDERETLDQEQDLIMSNETEQDLPVTINDIAGNALGVINNLLTTIDLPASTVKNLYKVIGRFCSAAVDIPIAHLEGVAAEKRAATEARVKLIREDAEQIAKRMNVPQEYVRRAGNKYAEKIIGEQINLDNISAFTLQELQKPETEKSSTQDAKDSNKDNHGVTMGQNTDNIKEKTIDDDWLNRFETEARQKSSEEMQRRFARVLAGEIQKPGSFSSKAVKTLGELDQNTAALFKKLCSVCVVFGISNIQHIIDIRVPSLGGNPGSNALKKYGLNYSTLNILNEYDLIISDYNSWSDYNWCIVNENNPIYFSFQHQDKHWVFLPLPDWNKDSKEFRVSGVALSSVGQELFQIVDQDPMPEYTEDLKKFFTGQKLQMVEVPIPIPRIKKA